MTLLFCGRPKLLPHRTAASSFLTFIPIIFWAEYHITHNTVCHIFLTLQPPVDFGRHR